MTGLDSFASWATDFDVDDAPDDVVKRATLQIASVFAGARAATTAEWFTAMADERDTGGTTTKGASGDGTATVVGDREADPYTAAFTNAAASTIHDYDDYLFMGHTGHSAVFASLAACERAGLDGAALVENVIIANELEGRLGAAVAVGPHNGQMWAFIHGAGAAAVTANVEGGETEIRDAVGMALYNPDFPYEAGFIDGDSKAFTAAKPTAAGLRIGDAATAGASASPDALSNFLDSYAFLPMPEMVGGFGESWITRTTSYKPRPGCAYVQAPLECLEHLTAEGLEPDDIESITVRAPLLSFGMEGMSRAYRDGRLLPVNVNFSVLYTLALHLVADGVTPDGLTEAAIEVHRGDLEAMADRISLEHDWDLTADVLDGLGAGVDYAPLISDRGLLTTGWGLKQLGDAHDSIATEQEVGALLRSGKIGRVLGSLRSPLDWEEFDIANARFDDLELAFGAVVEVETTSGSTHRASTTEHAGSCGRPLAETADVVGRKFEREIGDGFDRIMNAPAEDIESIASLL